MTDAIITGLAAFVGTNIDDLFLNAVFYAEAVEFSLVKLVRVMSVGINYHPYHRLRDGIRPCLL